MCYPTGEHAIGTPSILPRCYSYLCSLLMLGSCSGRSRQVDGLWAARRHGTILHVAVLQPAEQVLRRWHKGFIRILGTKISNIRCYWMVVMLSWSSDTAQHRHSLGTYLPDTRCTQQRYARQYHAHT